MKIELYIKLLMIFDSFIKSPLINYYILYSYFIKLGTFNCFYRILSIKLHYYFNHFDFIFYKFLKALLLIKNYSQYLYWSCSRLN